MLRRECVARELNRCAVADEPDAQFSGNARSQIATLRRGAEQRRAESARLDSIGCKCRRCLRIVLGEASVLANHHDISAVLSELLRLRRNSRSADKQSVNLTASCISKLSCRCNSLESNFAKLSVSRFRECKNICH